MNSGSATDGAVAAVLDVGSNSLLRLVATGVQIDREQPWRSA